MEERQIASMIWRTHLAAKTPWGTEDNTGSASIDWVLLDATRPLSAKEILEEVRRRGLPERKDANPHLSTLKRKGFVTNTPEGWCRVELAPNHSATVTNSPAPAQHAVLSRNATPTPVPSAPTPDNRDGTERLRKIKLILEIGVVLVSLIAGIVALCFRSR